MSQSGDAGPSPPSSDRADALKAQLDELRQLALTLTEEYHRVADASRQAEERGASAVDAVKELRERIAALSAQQGLSADIEHRLAALAELADEVTRKAGATRRRSTTIEHAVAHANRLTEVVSAVENRINNLQSEQPPASAARVERAAFEPAVPLPAPSKAVAGKSRRTSRGLWHRGAIAASVGITVLTVAAVRFAGNGEPLEPRAASPPPPPPAAVSTDVPAPVTAPSPPATRTSPVRPTAVRTRPAPRPQRRPRQFAGTLEIYSEPSGAAVFVNRERVGETPLRLPGLRAGSHVIWVEHDGFQRWTSGVLVPADKLTRLTARLKPGSIR